MKIKKINWKVFIVSLIIVYLCAFIGSIFTSTNVDSEWYNSVRSSLTPPNWVFPVVWNILFFLISLSIYFSWTCAKNEKIKKKIILFFGINLILNILWSVFYFGMKNPLFGFFDLILIWISILGLILFTYKISKTASYLLIPYFLWVSFAGILNYLSLKVY